MTRPAILLAYGALLGLASCSNEPAAPPPTRDESSPAPVATVTETASASPGPQASASPSPGASSAQTIPAAAQGRWGLVPTDCTSTRGDAKGLLTIAGSTLKFYESRGTLGKIAEHSDTRIRATFAFSGEGSTWSRDEVLDVQDGGKTLIRREYGKDAAPGPFKYARCPA